MNNNTPITNPSESTTNAAIPITYFEVLSTATHNHLEIDLICIPDGDALLQGGRIKNQSLHIVFYFCLHEKAERLQEIVDTSYLVEQPANPDNLPSEDALLFLTLSYYLMIAHKDFFLECMNFMTFIEAPNSIEAFKNQ